MTDECPICFDIINKNNPTDYIKLTCSHLIHIECLQNWIKKSPNPVKSCAFCRKDCNKLQEFDTYKEVNKLRKDLYSIKYNNRIYRYKSFEILYKFLNMPSQNKDRAEFKAQLRIRFLEKFQIYNTALIEAEESTDYILLYNELCNLCGV